MQENLITDKERAEAAQEYEEVCRNIRHQSTVFYSGAGVYATVNMLALRFFAEQPIVLGTPEAFLATGLWLMSFIFLLVEGSSLYLWTHFVQRAAYFETILGFKQFSTLPGAPRFNRKRPAAIAMIFFYLAGVTLWFYLALRCWKLL